MRNFIIVLLGVLVSSTDSFGAVNRYMVFFKDKENSTFSIDKPEEFLSERALTRRNNQNISMTSNDLPVSPSYLDQLADLPEVNVFFATKWLNGVLVETDEGNLDEIKLLPFVNEVKYVAPNHVLTGSGNRRHSKKEYMMMSDTNDAESQSQNAFIGVDIMHNSGYRGEGMLIAVFDSGFDDIDNSSFFSHLFTGDKILGTRDFIRNSRQVFQYDQHGSKVLSCISAFKEGVYTGTAPQADLVLCVTEDVGTEYRIEEYNWLFAAEYADSLGVDVINSSVGYFEFDDERMDYSYDRMDGNTAIITVAADLAASKGILVVASNGNEGNNSWKYLNAPADADSILAVGSVTYDKIKSGFSSYGPSSDDRIKPELSALGSNVKVAFREQIGSANGTSFSSPLLAGLAAGFWQAFPQLTNMEVIQYLKMSASQAHRPDTLQGYGIPNFTLAFNKAKLNEGGIEEKLVVFPNPVTHKKIIISMPIHRPSREMRQSDLPI
ncbi:MAG: S8 family serine peptidase [Cyclobacteriaceae bacterium]|nr:S8 family serine peptidase [Cyclobacteriaceae bacterium]